MSDPICQCGCGKPGVSEGKRFLQGHYIRNTPLMTDPSRITVEDRGHTTACWITTARKDKDGYGLIISGPRSLRGNYRAHIRAYQESVGPIPEGMVIHHLCEQPGCVRPDHLEPLTHAKHKQRHAKLTEEIVAIIRSSASPTRELAERFGVDPSTIRYARRGDTWR